MKVSKRSLIVSIAVLCVCALSLSAASFAWFTNSKAAKIDTLNMSVTARSSLQIRIQGTEEWKSVLNATDFINAGKYVNGAILNDASTADGSLWTTATFNPDTLQHEFHEGAEAISSTKTEGHYLMLPVEFRATDSKDVIVTTGQLEATGKPALGAALRVAFNDKIYANNTAAEATWQPATGDEQAITLAGKSLTNAVVASLGNLNEGYYYSGNVNICVWIEGSDKACIDGNTPATVTTMLQFGQAA
ncbi:MAG: hypothetical protein IJC52_05310 [Clostridia bacterium]|nr:hypothetical protein [Clostridia bacterium]